VGILRLVAVAFGVIGLVLLTLLAIGFLLPSEWEAERSAVIAAPPEAIFPHVESAEAWSRWTPSPDTGVELFGPQRGEGSGRRWDDPGYGKGEFVITRSDPPRAVRYEVEVEGGAIRVLGEIRLQEEADGTRIHWREEGDFGWNPLLGYLAGRMTELQGAQLEASLRSLRGLVMEGSGSVEDPGASSGG
jgi:uncharacterized protein YndB with AHSA1/START domain